MVISKISISLLIVVTSCIQALPAPADENSLKDLALPLVNAKRLLHYNTPNLDWSFPLEEDAQSCAMSAAKTKTFDSCYKMNHHYGKIFYTLYAPASNFPADFIIDYIVNSIYEKYGAEYPYGTKLANPFSQLIWKSSSQLGVGLADSEGVNNMHNYYIVFYFSASGNVGDITSFIKNVQPPIAVPTQAPPVITVTETAAPPPAKDLEHLRALCLSEHNTKRALHLGTPDMVYDLQIERSAQLWADHLAVIQEMKHEDPTQYGENIYRGYTRATSPISGENAIKGAIAEWYSEISDYDYKNPGYSSETGHFTQVIWKASTKLGCAISRYEKDDGKKFVIVVARYSSPGNYPGQFTTNVLPL